MKRRTMLAAVGTATTGLAGCLASGNDDEGGNESDGTASDGGSSRSTLGDTEIETTETRCTTADDVGTFTADRNDGTVTIDGITPASNPCHEAVLADAAIRDRRLDVRVDISAHDGACQSCTGAIEYALTADVANADELEGLTLEHGAGRRYSHEWDESEESSS